MKAKVDTSTYSDKWPNGEPIERTVIDPDGNIGVPMVRFKTPEGFAITTSLVDYNNNFQSMWDECKQEMSRERKSND